MSKMSSIEYRQNMSIACSGEKNGMFGKKQKESTKQLIREKVLTRCQDIEYHTKLSNSAVLAATNRWKNKEYKKKQSLAISISLKGRVFSDIHKQNISKSLKGRPAWNKGYGDYMRGSKNPMYRHGMNIEYPVTFNKLLRNKIRLRDNHTCQACFEIQKNRLLSIHHIDWNKDNSDESNLISLCQSCHQKIHATLDIQSPLMTDPTEPTSSGDRISSDYQKTGTQWSSQK